MKNVTYRADLVAVLDKVVLGEGAEQEDDLGLSRVAKRPRQFGWARGRRRDAVHACPERRECACAAREACRAQAKSELTLTMVSSDVDAPDCCCWCGCSGG